LFQEWEVRKIVLKAKGEVDGFDDDAVDADGDE
jgi:hypothetical protein